MYPRHVAVLVGTISLMLAISSCAKPEYWVAGLTLPSGSTNVTPVEDALGSSAALVPPSADFKDVMAVYFDNAGGWEAVVSHIESCLTRQGYQEALTGQSHQAEITQLMGFDMSKIYRMYSKSGSQYMVSLTDFAALMQALAKSTGQSMPSNLGDVGMGDFVLTVYRLEKAI